MWGWGNSGRFVFGFTWCEVGVTVEGLVLDSPVVRLG